MYFFEKQTIKIAFDALKNHVDNKFLGVLGILKSINSTQIEENKTYKIVDGELSRWLDETCYLEEFKGTYGCGNLYIRFSKQWVEFIAEKFFSSNISIYTLIVFLYKNVGFEHKPTYIQLLSKFCKDYHITQKIVWQWFSNNEIDIKYTTEPALSKVQYKELFHVKASTLSFISPYSVVARAGELSRAPFFQTLYAGMDAIKCLLILKENIDLYYNSNNSLSMSVSPYSLQQIYYGAPGTGKSHEIDKMTNKDNSFRITFHPDTDYASFVGAYKPTMVSTPVMALNGYEAKPAIVESDKKPLLERKIFYKFMPQAFLKAYVKAWSWYIEDLENDTKRPFYLVIEEINRGNCAQIFGDIFQLLDRCRNGYSSYAITPDLDIENFLKADERGFLDIQLDADFEITNDEDKPIATFEDIKEGRIMVLPPNLHILATMNTSDQSLFPIDSAFKRRWDWKYMKIKDAGKAWQIDVETAQGEDKEKVQWWDFLQKINRIIADMTSSADKQLGYFFCKPDEKVSEDSLELNLISKDKFVGKVLFYLWNDVFKDYGFDDADLFKYTVTGEGGKEIDKELTFPDFYNDDNTVNAGMVSMFVTNVLKWDKNFKA